MPPENALFAKLDAWLKRSQRENATVFVMVRTRAIARYMLATRILQGRCLVGTAQLTNQTKPNNIVQSPDRQDRKSDPECRSRIHAQPEKPLVGSIDGACVRIRALEDPMRITRCCINFVPPAQAD